MPDAKHRIVIFMGKGDTWPYVSDIECDWGTDPARPCRGIHCDYCHEDASDECLDGETAHEGAHVIEGCGIRDWFEQTAIEGIVVETLQVKVPMDVHWNGDTWTLTARGAADA